MVEICPKCGSDNMDSKLIVESNDEMDDVFRIACLDCGYEWYE